MSLAALINNYRLEMEAISPQIEIYLLLSEASQRELSLAFNERAMSNKVFQILA
jgi:hypothetical protein